MDNIELRNYQKQISDEVIVADFSLNLICQADTGAGKTHIIADVVHRSDLTIVIAHRNLLIRQLSTKLAQHKIRHSTICSDYTRRMCILDHRKEIGDEYIDASVDDCYVSSIDTLISMHRSGRLKVDRYQKWRIIVDEAHHIVDENKWGELTRIFPNAQIVGFTATPTRGDGQSLKKGSGGIFDQLIQADDLKKDSVKKLISLGYLTDFGVFTIPDFTEDSRLICGKNGEYTHSSMLAVFNDYEYVFAGSALKHYEKICKGKQTVVFCVNINAAERLAKTFRDAGYSSACISSRMSQVEVARIFNLFKEKIINVIFHVDMLGEGIDVPAIECLILLKKTASIVNFRQWIGRSLRPERGKDRALIIDHCANVLAHGMPDDDIAWSLDNTNIDKKSNLISCDECNFTYKAWEKFCPECGAENTRFKRGSGDAVHGLKFIDIDLVEKKRALIDKIEMRRSVVKIRDFGRDSISQAKSKIMKWIVDVANDNFSIEEINDFFDHVLAKKGDYLVDNFSIFDIKKDNRKKVMREFLKWKKESSN